MQLQTSLHDANCTIVVWVVNPTFTIHTAVYFHLHCNSKICSMFRAVTYLYFLLESCGRFCCLVITCYIVALTFGQLMNCLLLVFLLKGISPSLNNSCEDEIRLPFKSLLDSQVPSGSHLGWILLKSGRNLGVPVLGEKERVRVTDAFRNHCFCTFQHLFKVP